MIFNNTYNQPHPFVTHTGFAHTHADPKKLISKISTMDLFEVISEIGKIKMDIYTYKKAVDLEWAEKVRQIAIDKELIGLLRYRRDTLKCELASKLDWYHNELPQEIKQEPAEENVEPEAILARLLLSPSSKSSNDEIRVLKKEETQARAEETRSMSTPVESPVLNAALFEEIAEELIADEPATEDSQVVEAEDAQAEESQDEVDTPLPSLTESPMGSE